MDAHHDQLGTSNIDQHPGVAHKHHVLPLKMYFGVWGALMALTALTVGVAFIPVAWLHVPSAIGIATIKAALVALVFMHLWWDEKFNLVLMLNTIVVVLIFLVFTLMDPLTRGDVNLDSARPLRAEMGAMAGTDPRTGTTPASGAALPVADGATTTTVPASSAAPVPAAAPAAH